MIHHGDCLTVMRDMEPASVDAIVTDPPYCAGSVAESRRTAAKGQGRRSENISRFGWFVGDNMGTAGLAWLLRSVAVESRRLVRPSGHLLVFCDWRMLATLQPAIESSGWRSQNLVVWNKGSMGLGVGFRAQHELVMHFTSGSPVYHDRRIGNVITVGRVSRNRVHQTEKPVDLMRSLLRVVTPPGGTVLDPFTGSGTTGCAAALEGFQFVGIEQEAEYVEIARQRIAHHAKEPSLPLEVTA